MSKVSDRIFAFAKSALDKINLLKDSFSRLSPEDQNLVYVELLCVMQISLKKLDPALLEASGMNKNNIYAIRQDAGANIETLRPQSNEILAIALKMQAAGRKLFQNFDPANAFASLPLDVQNYLKMRDCGHNGPRDESDIELNRSLFL